MARKLTSQELDACVRELPVAPTILARLQELLAADATNVLDVIPLLRLDPALSASVVRLARSPLYQRATLPDTLDESVVRLGFAEINRLVSYTIMRQIAEPVPLYGLSAEDFWKRSVACALAMELLAERYDVPPGTPYLTGLMHAVGGLLLQRMVSREGGNQPLFDPTSAEGIAAQEVARIGIHQGNVAARALRLWAFPEVVATAVENQFAPRAAGTHAPTAILLVTAKWLAYSALGENDLAAGLVARKEFDGEPTEKHIELVPFLQARIAALDIVLAGLEVAG